MNIYENPFFPVAFTRSSTPPKRFFKKALLKISKKSEKNIFYEDFFEFILYFKTPVDVFLCWLIDNRLFRRLS